MSHRSCCRRSLSSKSFMHKHNLPKTFMDNQRSPRKSSCPSAKAVSSLNMNTDVHSKVPHKVKRLKTRKERNEIRFQPRNWPHSNKGEGREKTQSCHIQKLACSRKDSIIAKPFITQKPSIITEHRLTSIRGLFSHEIKSIDIERLVSEQIKHKQGKVQRKDRMSSRPPSLHDSDQDGTLVEVLNQEIDTSPQAKRKKRSSKAPMRKDTSGFQNISVVVPNHLSSEDGIHSRNTRKRHATSTKRQDSPREMEHLVSSPVEKDPIHLFRSNTVETNNKSSIKSPDDGNQEKGFIDSRKCKKTSTAVGFPNMEVPDILENPENSNTLHDLHSGPDQLAENSKQREGKKSSSCRETVKRLVTRLCQASELPVLSHRRPFLDENREMLMQTLQKRHGFQLEHNLHSLHSVLNGEQRASQLNSGQRRQEFSSFSPALKNEDRDYSRKLKIWTDSAMQHDYLAEAGKRGLDRRGSTKRTRMQEWKTSPSTLFLKKPRLQLDMDMFDQWRTDEQSRDRFGAQHPPCNKPFNQEQMFTQHAVSLNRASTLLDDPVHSYSQQPSLSRGESLKHVHLDLPRISQQWNEEINHKFSSYDLDESRSQKPQETSFEGARFWSPQVQDDPFSFSTSFLSPGFRSEPFFRCPHPSDMHHRPDFPDLTLSPIKKAKCYPLFSP